MGELISFNASQMNCKHDWQYKRQDDGTMRPDPESLCQKCGVRFKDIMVEYESKPEDIERPDESTEED